MASPGPRPGSRSTSDAGDVDETFSYPLFRDIEGLVDEALEIAAHRDFRANLAYRGQTSDAEGVLVSGHYFPALQLRPALGRLLGADDDRVPGAHPVVVLSHSYWSTRFGSDPSVIDDTLDRQWRADDHRRCRTRRVLRQHDARPSPGVRAARHGRSTRFAIRSGTG